MRDADDYHAALGDGEFQRVLYPNQRYSAFTIGGAFLVKRRLSLDPSPTQSVFELTDLAIEVC